jgi:hypothetical protein
MMQTASRQSKHKFCTQVKKGRNRKGRKECVEYTAFAGKGILQTSEGIVEIEERICGGR